MAHAGDTALPDVGRFSDDPCRSHTLPGSYYYAPGVFELEKRAIFNRTWQYVCHLSRVAEPGRYCVRDIGDQSVVVLRDRGGELRAFHNVCQHRAHRLVEGAGRLGAAIVCPYHNWSYELSGELRLARHSEEVADFDRGTICLSRVRAETFCGFVFVNLDPDAEPMDTWYPGIADALAEYLPDPERLRPVCTREVTERCNWKVSVENYSECYHCRLNHPTFSNGVVEADSYDIVPHGRVLRHVTKSVPVESLTYRVDPDSHPHALDYTSWFLWPTFSFQVYPGNVLNTYVWQAVDHRTTRVTRQWFAAEGAEPDLVESLAEQDLRTTVAEDVRLVESVQRGLESGGYRPAPLVIDPAGGVNSEHSIRALYEWLGEAMA